MSVVYIYIHTPSNWCTWAWCTYTFTRPVTGVHECGVHYHIHTSSTRGCASVYFAVQYYIEYSGGGGSLTMSYPTLWPHGLQHATSFTISLSFLKLMSIESVMPSNHFILCHPLLLLPSVFPSIRVFSNVSPLCNRWPKNLINFNIRPSSEYYLELNMNWDWLVWSPYCPRDSQESSLAPQFKTINSSVFSLLYGPTLTSIHDNWKNHSFDYIEDHCWQSDVSAF